MIAKELARYLEHVGEHVTHELNFSPPGFDDDRLWALLEGIGWTDEAPDAEAATARAQALPLLDALMLGRFFEARTIELSDVVLDLLDNPDVAATPEFAELRRAVDSNAVASTLEHVVGLGRAAYEAALADPQGVFERARDRRFGECFEVFSHWARIVDPDADQLDAALRAGSVIRSFDDPAGWAPDELVDHPEHGLGFVILDPHTPWIALQFRATSLTMRRPERAERSITLYFSAFDPPFYWYASVSAPDPEVTLFTSTGGIGRPRLVRVYPPCPAAEALARFEALVADRRKHLFEEREHELVGVALRLDDGGLERPDRVRREVLAAAARVVAETGNGEFNGRLTVTRSSSTLYFDVIQPKRAAETIANALGYVDGTAERFELTPIPAEGEGASAVTREPCSDPILALPNIARIGGAFTLEPDRRFTLAPDQGYFEVGATADGRLALMATAATGPFGLWFDPEGRLLEYTRQPPGHELEAWQRELGFVAQAIHVRAFWCADEQVGITLLPSVQLEFLEDPEAAAPEPGEREQTLAEIRGWLERGDFVLRWGDRDLWLDRDGHVAADQPGSTLSSAKPVMSE
jgi:hypothetical protein